MSKDTLFTTDASGQSAVGPGQYVQDNFRDVVLPADSNSGLTDSVSTNPIRAMVGDADVPRYGAKVLWIRGLELIEDRTKWVDSRLPTYRVIWHEDYPAVVGYVASAALPVNGSDLLSSNARRTILKAGDFGVVCKARKVAFLAQNKEGGSPPAGLLAADALHLNFNVSESGNATNDLHDFRLVDGSIFKDGVDTTNTISGDPEGVIVYFENSDYTVACGPGTIYANKSPIDTTSETGVSLPSYGSSFGGVGTLYKTSSGYAFNALSSTTIVSIAQGLSGTNLLNVSTGHGSSFQVGNGLVVDQSGGSHWVGSIQQVSTDTLTVYPTLPFGISNAVYRAWQAGASLAVGSSFMRLSSVIDFKNYTGASGSIFDPSGEWGVWWDQAGVTTLDYSAMGYTGIQSPALCLNGATGYLYVQGRFSEAEIIFSKPSGTEADIHATFSVNGTPAFSKTEFVATSDPFRQSVMAKGPGGWNSFNVGIGPTTQVNAFFIQQINLYQRSGVGASYGNLARIETYTSFANRFAINASLMAIGTAQRVYSDQMHMAGGWTRIVSPSAVAGVGYRGSTTNCIFTQRFYGKDFALIGTQPTSYTTTIDGVGASFLFNRIVTGSTEMFHTVTYRHLSGTSIIEAFDFTARTGPISYLGTSSTIRPNPIGATTLLIPSTSDWTSFTPTGTLSTNITYTGRYKRQGDTVQFQVTGVLSGATDTSSVYINIPFSWVIDDTKLTTTTQTNSFIPDSGGNFNDATGNAYFLCARYDTTTRVRIVVLNASTWATFSNTGPVTMASGDAFTINFSVPIVGLSNYV